MPRRLPSLRRPLLALTVGLFALASAITAQPPAPPTPPAGDNPGTGIKRDQEENLRKYKRFADELLKLAQKWEKSDNPDERERAKSLRAALAIADKHGVEALFNGVIRGLARPGTPTGNEFADILAKDKILVDALEEILLVLETEDEADRIRREIVDLQELIKKVQQIKRDQETLRARTDIPKSDPNRLSKDQGDLAKQTKDLAEKMKGGNPKDAKNANANPNAPDDKAEPKPEGKPGDSNAEPKGDTKDPKSDSKDPAGDPKPGAEPKPDAKGGKPDAGSDRDPPKDQKPDPMGGKGMGDPKPMPGDPKADQPKPSESASKPMGSGKGDSKPSPGQGGDAKPMSPGGMPMPNNSPPSDSKPSPGGQPNASPPNASPAPPNPNQDAQRKVEEAVPDQKDAEDALKKDDRPKAGKNEDDAIRKLNEALKELEKRLKQLREKEMLRKLEDLERRVKKMLDLQIQVYEATKAIDGSVKKNNGVAGTADKQKAGVEAEREGTIVDEAERALRLLEGEGTAVVFAGVLAELKKDMEAIQKQLNAANVGSDTQLVEEQVIAQLKRMLEALKKAKQDLENPPPPPPPGQSQPNDGKKNLIQLVEQLKLLRELQLQVNERTIAFSKKAPGEQASDPFIQEQLRQLGERQKILQDMLHKIAIQMSQQ